MSILRVRDNNGNVTDILAIRGNPGPKGDPGKTPVLGLDYFTDADKQKMVDAVLEQMPEPEGGLPDVTTEHNGKFARVVDGKWAAVAVDNAEEASF